MSNGSSPASDRHASRAVDDLDPVAFSAARAAVAVHARADVHALVAERLAARPPGPVLDVGCGDGALHEVLPAAVRRWWVGLDVSPSMAATAPRPACVADALALPVRSASVAAVTALWVLHQLADPVSAVAEARRALGPGGLFLTCSTRRDDSPELASHFDNEATAFDAEEAPAIVAGQFADVEVVSWDAPLVHLPDRTAVVAYLCGRGASDEAAAAVADDLSVPLDITRRGCLVIGTRA